VVVVVVVLVVVAMVVVVAVVVLEVVWWWWSGGGRWRGGGVGVCVRVCVWEGEGTRVKKKRSICVPFIQPVRSRILSSAADLKNLGATGRPTWVSSADFNWKVSPLNSPAEYAANATSCLGVSNLMGSPPGRTRLRPPMYLRAGATKDSSGDRISNIQAGPANAPAFRHNPGLVREPPPAVGVVDNLSE
jgi:hypothetical protein